MEQLTIRPYMVFASMNRKDEMIPFDGSKRTRWVGGLTPGWFDVSFAHMVRLSRFEMETQNNSCCLFTVYASEDGVSFSPILKQDDEADRSGSYGFACDVLCCRLRVFIEVDSASPRARIRNLRLFGEETAVPAPQAEEPVVCAFEESEYARPVTKQDTIDELHALVSRLFGEERSSDFIFELTQEDEEVFTLSDRDGRVCVAANTGVNAAFGESVSNTSSVLSLPVTVKRYFTAPSNFLNSKSGA